MKTVYLLIGLPGAGKTTFAKQKLTNAKIIELDEVRQELSNKGIIGKEYSSQDNEIVFKEFNKCILDAISKNNEIVIDATNARLAERKTIYDLLKDYKPKFVIINFTDSKEVVLERIIKRQNENSNCVHYFKNPQEAIDIYATRIEQNKPSLSEPVAEIWQVENGEVINKDQKVLIASTNLGKINIYGQVCKDLNLNYTSLAEIKVDDKIEENGNNEEENAIIKATSYYKITSLPVIANDSGLIIDKFKQEDQPKALVRRYHGKELTDIELLNLYIEKLTEVGGESTGHYNVALALIDKNGELHSKMFYPKRYFINKPSKILKKGVPLSSLSFDTKSKRYLSEMSDKEYNDYEAGEMQKQIDFINDVFKNGKTTK